MQISHRWNETDALAARATGTDLGAQLRARRNFDHADREKDAKKKTTSWSTRFMTPPWG
jgi:hypothetical protein